MISATKYAFSTPTLISSFKFGMNHDQLEGNGRITHVRFIITPLPEYSTVNSAECMEETIVKVSFQI
ncbi:hypothetical protein CIHG_05429 [Coccidioides immitis H538.4]|uniref:Uncharacterized protein n=3 Tax=Coccidioides immitis TaxID=5501 RepID=A0A0J8R3V4_COCIT|nr:hypothetical protein CIRG_02221 [Coccidioides immitis RMSCC 2394]KMU79809.1 hypothetical protein CISG_08089 [Coccidioides immitis RMSCC 3703]KMU88258.1 hypothetical protein CIHG_05429 [Coccidioides immitis H538.4]